MCGIAGVYARGQGPVPQPQILEAMAGALIHRGPDAEGFHLSDDLGFAFRRLALLDLERGDQPMYSGDRQLVCICNGEIYNYRELKRELQARGHRFHTRSDVEVCTHLYQEYGPRFVERLNGQFAVALYDAKHRRLILARDHAGIAPLFHTLVGESLVFGSEIKAILAHPEVRAQASLGGLDQVLTFPGLVSPTTAFEGIHSLRPGHMLVVTPERIEDIEYWDLEFPQARDHVQRPESELVEELGQHLSRAVQLRLNADVPVGFYLSGGLDSSLLAAVVAELGSARERHSFSIAFPDRAIDERRFQRVMAEAVGSQHHEIEFEAEDIATRFERMIWHAETPVKESYNCCSLALAESVRAQGVKAVLTGEGADELFAGYVGHRLDGQRGPELQDPLERALETELRREMWGDEDLFYERNYIEFAELRQGLYAPAIRAQFDEFDCCRTGLVDVGKLAGRHPTDQRSYLDFKLRMADHLLGDHGDRLAYAHSVEARYPFLDPGILEFATRVPPSFKLRQGQEKYLLRRLAHRYLPSEVHEREKFGFVAPGSPYLLGRDLEWVRDHLSRAKIEADGFFDPDVVEALHRRYAEPGFRLNLPFDSDLLMTVLSFGVFKSSFSLPASAGA